MHELIYVNIFVAYTHASACIVIVTHPLMFSNHQSTKMYDETDGSIHVIRMIIITRDQHY